MVAPRSGNPRLCLQDLVIRPEQAIDLDFYHKRLPLPRHLFPSVNYLSLFTPFFTGCCRPIENRQSLNKYWCRISAAHQRPHPQANSKLHPPRPCYSYLFRVREEQVSLQSWPVLSTTKLLFLALHKQNRSLINRNFSFARSIIGLSLYPRRWDPTLLSSGALSETATTVQCPLVV
jgi:hypothetical protein